MEQNRESQIDRHNCPSAYDEGSTAVGKSLFRKDVHMNPDPYLTQISIPEGMHNTMQDKNDKFP